MLKNCNFYVTGKVGFCDPTLHPQFLSLKTNLLLKGYMLLFMVKSQYKDEFVTAGGVPLSEVSPSLGYSPFLPLLFHVHWKCNSVSRFC